MPLTADEGKTLLHLARRALQHYCTGGGDLRIQDSERKAFPDALLARRNAFVTLRKGRDLRGCIGSTQDPPALVDGVLNNVVAAASRDPRFAPVTSKEEGQLKIEISILGPMCRISGPQDLRSGIHGVFVRKGQKSGLLLPQVADLWGWDEETLLEQATQKAGLLPGQWKQAEMFCFAAQILKESSL